PIFSRKDLSSRKSMLRRSAPAAMSLGTTVFSRSSSMQHIRTLTAPRVFSEPSGHFRPVDAHAAISTVNKLFALPGCPTIHVIAPEGMRSCHSHSIDFTETYMPLRTTTCFSCLSSGLPTAPRQSSPSSSLTLNSSLVDLFRQSWHVYSPSTRLPHPPLHMPLNCSSSMRSRMADCMVFRLLAGCFFTSARAFLRSCSFHFSS